MSGRGDFLHLFFIQEEADLVRYSIENLKRIEVHGGSRGGKGLAGVLCTPVVNTLKIIFHIFGVCCVTGGGDWVVCTPNLWSGRRDPGL